VGYTQQAIKESVRERVLKESRAGDLRNGEERGYSVIGHG